MTDSFAKLTDLAAATDLSRWAFYRPIVVTPDGAPAITLPTLKAMADYALAGACDSVTAEELAVRVLASMDAILAQPNVIRPTDAHGRVVFDAPPAGGQGSVTRKPRTSSEKLALLQDAALPHEVRNEFERDLGFAVSPAPREDVKLSLPALVVGPDFDAEFPLPVIFQPDGGRVSYAAFGRIHQFTDGTTIMVWEGPQPLLIGRIVSGLGFDVPVPANAQLAVGGTVTVTLGKPNKVTATGLLMRDGKVVRDGDVTVAHSQHDLAVEAALRGETLNRIRAMVMQKASLGEMLSGVMKAGYARKTAEDMLAVELTGLGYVTAETLPKKV